MSNEIKMGTSTTGSEHHSDKLVKLQARKKEIEALLAAKNEELYKLCVQEVQLTGVMPPEAPVETGSTESSTTSAPPEKKEPETLLRKDPSDRRDKSRHSHRQSVDKVKELSRKQVSHRLSTPSISGLSVKSAPTRRSDHPAASCSVLPHGSDERDTFSMHSSQTYPSIPTSSGSRHHTLTSEQVQKLYYNTQNPEGVSFSRVHETHFSSSQPDITTRSSHSSLLVSPTSPPSHTPLLYQYAEQLRARSTHLSNIRPRRNTLQRTQTYHLTGHTTEHVPPHESMASLTLSPHTSHDSLSALTLPPLHTPPYHHPPPATQMSPYQHYPVSSVVSPAPSVYFGVYPDVPDQRVKEKEWYESSLDSPSSSGGGMNLSKESIQYHSPKKSLHRSPSVPQPLPPPQIESSQTPSPLPPPPLPPHNATPPGPPLPDVAFESPKNITVVESGKWIPYKEVSKPFEMSDFYKYSTKFRQNNNINTQKPRPIPNLVANASGYPVSSEDIRFIPQ